SPGAAAVRGSRLPLSPSRSQSPDLSDRRLDAEVASGITERGAGLARGARVGAAVASISAELGAAPGHILGSPARASPARCRAGPAEPARWRAGAGKHAARPPGPRVISSPRFAISGGQLWRPLGVLD